MISYLARANYDYMGKYLLSVSFRRDGCSRFGMNAKWANFPSVSAGWIASDESFMERFDRLSYLKLRGSYGIVGNYNIGNYNHLATIGTTTMSSITEFLPDVEQVVSVMRTLPGKQPNSSTSVWI